MRKVELNEMRHIEAGTFNFGNYSKSGLKKVYGLINLSGDTIDSDKFQFFVGKTTDDSINTAPNKWIIVLCIPGLFAIGDVFWDLKPVYFQSLCGED